MSFLRTGHSHEDIDQVFGSISSVIRQVTLDDPDDVVDALNRWACPQTAKEAPKVPQSC